MLDLKQLKANLQDRYQSMTIGEIFGLIKKLSIAAVICVLIFFYFTNKGADPVSHRAAAEQNITLTDEVLNRDLDTRIEEKVNAAVSASLDNYFNQAKHRLVVTEKGLAESEKGEPIPSTNDTSEPNQQQGAAQGITLPAEDNLPSTDDLTFQEGVIENPTPPTFPEPQQATFREINGTPEPESFAPTYVEYGGINMVQFEEPQAAATPNEGAQSFLIPTGFMPAKLLVGVRAQTSNDANGDPKPIHLRVQAPATLPNKVRMNLAGCFVIANTWGNLASERIEGELKSMHCISRDKKTLIEGDLFGYIADTDGQRDMHGRVVTKAGALLARQVAADTLSGLGNVVASSSGTQQTSPLGTVTTLNGDEMLQAGFSEGLSSGFKRTADHISSLVVQSAPIIEAGAAKDVVLMIQKTSEITVRKLEMGEMTQ